MRNPEEMNHWIQEGRNMRDNVLATIEEGADMVEILTQSRGFKDTLHKVALQAIDDDDHHLWNVVHEATAVLTAVTDTWFACNKAALAAIEEK